MAHEAEVVAYIHRQHTLPFRLKHPDWQAQYVTSSYLLQVRQLSGVLLRKHLRSHWRRLPASAHKQIQTALQQRLVQESVEPVRRAVAELIASIARSDHFALQANGLLRNAAQCNAAVADVALYACKHGGLHTCCTSLLL